MIRFLGFWCILVWAPLLQAAPNAIDIWKSLPPPAARAKDLEEQTKRLPFDDAWGSVLRLYFAALANHRAAMIEASQKLRLPDSFPNAAAEAASFDALVAKGINRVEAGLRVVSERSFEPLFALRDLDKILGREAEYLRQENQAEQAAILIETRDRLREAYLKSSRNAIEKLFALSLLERTEERAQLLHRMREVEYLSDPKALRTVLQKLGSDAAWENVVSPLLRGDLELIQNPPEIPTQAPGKAALAIKSPKPARDGVYRDATAALQGLIVKSGELILNSRGELLANGKTTITGHPMFPKGIQADRAVLDTNTLSFSLEGRVILRGSEKESYMTACTLGIDGTVTHASTLDERFGAAPSILEKLTIAKEMSEWYPPGAMPEEARYLRALDLLRPHLSWHAGFSSADAQEISRKELRDAHGVEPGSPWRPANSGETWMQEDIPASVREEADKRRERDGAKLALGQASGQGEYFWLLEKPGHPDVATAEALLSTLRNTPLAAKAEGWLADIRRNNTVITFDVPGAVTAKQNATLMMDVRAAEKVTFKLYKIENRAQLASVCHRIGEDFIFRNHRDAVSLANLIQEPANQAAFGRTAIPPTQLPESPVAAWEINVSTLSVLNPGWENFYDGESGWECSSDGAYFNDACIQYEDRLNRCYDLGEGSGTSALSGWQLARAVEIPGNYLESGAYVLAAEANGQLACAPLLVDPLSLATRRCRDGIFALVATENGAPVRGARFAGTAEVLNPGETSDVSGAAFIRMYGGGDRALIAEADGRFAIAGFGRVFEGIYLLEDRQIFAYPVRLRELEAQEQVGRVFEDRLVAAAFTDRPTYRPGQQVQAKLILRELASEVTPGAVVTGRFREEDFDSSARMALLPTGTEISYEILDPKGRTVADGTCELNDFGTAGIRFDLNPETKTGSYSIRLNRNSVNHVIPEAFQVLYYRRPNFEVKVSGIPELLPEEGESLNVSVAGVYYFGQPLSAGTARVRLVQAGNWQPLLQEELALSGTGEADFSLVIPRKIGTGNLLLVAEISDASGRTEVSSHQLGGRNKPSDPANDLPRFVQTGKQITIKTSDSVAIRPLVDGKKEWSVSSSKGEATLSFSESGWYEVTRGSETSEIFAFPVGEGTNVRLDANEEIENGWVNLANYADPFGNEGGSNSALGAAPDVWALFEGHHAEIGKPLRLLLYVPSRSPRVVITVEGRTIVDYSVHEISAPFQVVEVPVTDRWLPNAYLQACGLPGTSDAPEEILQAAEVAELEEDGQEEEDPRWCRVDVIDPYALAHGEDLLVSLETDKEEYKPGEAVQVTMAVTDKAGKPKEAELALTVVDDSIFTFGEGWEKSIAQRMNGARPERRYLDKQWRVPLKSESYKLAAAQSAMAVMQEAAQQLDRAVSEAVAMESHAVPYRPTDILPSGEITLPRLRQDFRETAAWFPQVRTDAKGIAHSTFHLPDSLTRYRLTALGLTRDTMIGSNRASIRAALPLSVQLFLPRFAVENDRLLAVGLVHNSTAEPRDVEVTWEATGVELQAAKPSWQVRESAGKQIVSGRVHIPARGQARVTLPLMMVQPGEAILTLRAGGGEAGDSERRPLKIFPWGRQVEFARQLTAQSAASISLPRDLILERMEVSLRRTSKVEVIDALDGLQYLIDYPYGCVEQTMSRLMPAIVARDAVRNTGFKLPPPVEAKLPDVVSRGLTRIYNFQHEDGGWGWWEKDQTDDRMSFYVLYGLARCKAAGTGVDAQVLSRGLDWLKSRMSEKDLSGEFAARGWRILALCGEVDSRALLKSVEQLAKSGSRETLAELALACRDAGEADAALRLWNKVRNLPADDVTSLALHLTAQMAFREPLADCYATAQKLTALRQGYTFGSTWDTSRAIDGLARVIPLAPRPTFDGTKDWAEVRWGGRALADSREGIGRRVFTGTELPVASNDPVAVEVTGDKSFDVTLTASGFQRITGMEALGDKVRVTRSYRTLDGKLLQGPVKQGQMFEVQVTLMLAQPQDYLIVEDKRPAGCEYGGDQVHGPLAGRAAHHEFRDDSVSIFFTRLEGGTHTFSYLLRAETPGLSHVRPGFAYPMYAERTRGETSSDIIEIEAPE